MQHKYDYNKHHYRYHRVFDETSSAYVLIDMRGNQYVIDKNANRYAWKSICY